MDTRPRIVAEPNPVPHSERPGSVVVSWDTGDGSPGEVWVNTGDTELLFSREASGAQEASWIQPGVVYEFQLRRRGKKGKSGKPLATTTVAMTAAPALVEVPPAAKPSRSKVFREKLTRRRSRKTAAFIRAEPNPIPVGPGLGSTTISWSTGNGRVGAIYLVVAGGEEIPFQQGAEGSHHVNWIQRDVVYRFRLYEMGEERVRLAATTVTMGNEPLEIARDMAFLAGLVAIPVALLVAIVGAGRRLARWAARIRSPHGRSWPT